MEAQTKSHHAPLWVAIATPVILFFLAPPLSRGGLWDARELAIAEAARHVGDAVQARPSLPTALVAFGFRVFGAHDWAGRLPMAFVALLGVLATYAWVARLVDRRAGAYAAIALSTMPLFFVQARAMLGDGVAMSASSAAFGGLAVLLFAPIRARERAAWSAMALAGLAAGLASRGAILGVAMPCLGVGAAWGRSARGTAFGARIASRMGSRMRRSRWGSRRSPSGGARSR